MNEGKVRLLLVDDEGDFRRAASTTLSRRGFAVTEAAGGQEALESVRSERPDVVVLDLKMPGMSGIEALRLIREIEPDVPVIILTGHGDYQSAVAGIRLGIVDFLQKPVDMDQLGERIRGLLDRGDGGHLHEPTIAELMVSPSVYPRLYVDQPIIDALKALKRELVRPGNGDSSWAQVRSARVYGRDEKFIGMVRVVDLLKLVLPPFLQASSHATFFTGMFLAQCKVVGNRNILELLGEQASVDIRAPLMEAVHLMVDLHVVNLPVMKEGELVGVLRGREVILEIARSIGFEPD